MPFMTKSDRVYRANSLGQMGDVTADDVKGWLTIGTSVISAASPLIQTFVPSQYQATINPYLQAVQAQAPKPPQAAPPAVTSVGQQNAARAAQGGFALPAWAPWVLLAAVGGYLLMGRARGGDSRRSNPRRHTRRRSNPLNQLELARIHIGAAQLRRRAIQGRRGTKRRAALLGMSAGMLRAARIGGGRLVRITHSGMRVGRSR